MLAQGMFYISNEEAITSSFRHISRYYKSIQCQQVLQWHTWNTTSFKTLFLFVSAACSIQVNVHAFINVVIIAVFTVTELIVIGDACIRYVDFSIFIRLRHVPKSEPQSYNPTVCLWHPNPFFVIHSIVRFVTAENSSVTDIFYVPIEIAYIRKQSGTDIIYDPLDMYLSLHY